MRGNTLFLQIPGKANFLLHILVMETEPIGTIMAALAKCNRNFTSTLCQVLDSRHENQFFSPHGILTVLAMIYAGSTGQTKKEFDEVIWSILPGEGIDASFEAVAQRLAALQIPDEDGASQLEFRSEYRDEDEPLAEPSDYGFHLQTVNGIWRQKGYPGKKPYLDLLDKFYGAAVAELDFGDAEQACETINGWVNEHTAGLIPQILQPADLPSLTRMILSNAMYFRSAWASEFFEGDTSEESFHNSDGTISQVPMMRQNTHFRYSRNDAGEILELPYIRPEIVCTVFLPRLPTGNSVLLRSRADALIGNELFAVKEDAEVKIHLPKFEFDYSVSLKEMLRSLGLHRIFSPDADLTSISDEPEYCVDEIIHKTFVSIDETGTQAAAVSIATMVGAAPVESPKPIEMKVDRPFWFFICDRDQKIILFAGCVNNLQ